jgi:hypothetical protein
MKFKPWPIVILALLHFLSPVWTVCLSAWLLGTPLKIYLHELFLYGRVHDFLSLLIFPVAGLVIYLVERWSYPVYLALMFVVTLNNGVLWHDFPKPLNLFLILAVQAGNIAVVTYFLHPRIKTVFLDPRVKWWKSKPRYPVQMPCWIATEDKTQQAQVMNISQGGLFAVCAVPLTIGSQAPLRLEGDGGSVWITAKVVYQAQNSHGFQFIHSSESHAFVLGVIERLKRSGGQPIGRISRFEDLKRWANRLLRTGNGLIPEVSNSVTLKSVNSNKTDQADAA